MLSEQVHKDLGVDPQKSKGFGPRVNLNLVRVVEMNYDFMPCDIKTCQSIKIVNLQNPSVRINRNGSLRDVPNTVPDRLEDFQPYQAAMTTHNKALIKLAAKVWKDAWKQTHPDPPQRKKKEGAFWRWICKLPINLERYMIFNKLDERTAHLMEDDNCLIYMHANNSIYHKTS